MHTFVGTDRDRPPDRGERSVRGGRQRLLDQRDAGGGASREVGGEIVGGPAFVGVDDQLRMRRRLPHGGDAFGIVPAAELDLEEFSRRRRPCRVRHRLRRAERDRIGGGERLRGRQPGQLMGGSCRALGFEIPEGAVERVASGAGGHGLLERRAVEAEASLLPMASRAAMTPETVSS